MQGSINFDGTLSGSIAGGGGGGGSEVSITPVLTQGTKIAEFEIDGEVGFIYAPEAGDSVEVTPTLNSGDKVADIEVNGVNKALYSQSYGYANDTHDTNSETIGGFQKGNNITPIMVKAVSYADQTGADGKTIGVLSVGDTNYDVKQTLFNLDGQEHLFGKISNNAYVYYKYITTNNIPSNSWDSIFNAGYPILFLLGNIETSNGVKWGLGYSTGNTFFNYYINGSDIIINWGGYTSNNTVANLLVFYVKST